MATKKAIEQRKVAPNYKIKCIVCEGTPTIDSKTADGKIEHLEMCGACTWGEADAIDPENW